MHFNGGGFIAPSATLSASWEIDWRG